MILKTQRAELAEKIGKLKDQIRIHNDIVADLEKRLGDTRENLLGLTSQLDAAEQQFAALPEDHIDLLNQENSNG